MLAENGETLSRTGIQSHNAVRRKEFREFSATVYRSSRMYTMSADMTSKFNTPEDHGNSSEKQTPGKKLRGITPKSSKITKGTFQIVRRPARRGHGVIVPGGALQVKETKPQSNAYSDSVSQILELRVKREQELASKVQRFKEKLAKLTPEDLEKLRKRFAPGA
jgi:hypothetical protein